MTEETVVAPPSANQRKYLLVYLLASVGISSAIYYFPDYTLLELLTARHSAGLLRLLGLQVQNYAVSGASFLDGFEIVRDCTGVQVLAFFAGLVLPAKGISTLKKALMVFTASTGLYVVNVARIAVQILMYHSGLLEWTEIHDLFGRLLSGMAVFAMVMIYAAIVPEFKEFLLGILSSVVSRKTWSLSPTTQQ
ncbi:MAG: exosortase/archaeosortase family protein [archaeon]